MKHFLLYGHGGSYNHGAEAIVKTTIKLIREKYTDAYIAISSHFPEQDKEYKIDADELFSPISEFWDKEKLAKTAALKEQLAKRMYINSLDFITPDTICLSIGGDNFCYPNWHRLNVFQKEVKRKNAKSILWGCSVEPSTITPEMAEVLSSYNHILTRESKTYKTLNEYKINADIKLLPDPAFLLETIPIDMPENFKPGNIVGINISPLVMRKEISPGIIKENLHNLIDFIISETNMTIALIPHVIMPMDNDYTILSEIEQSLPPSFRPRVWLANEKYSAAELKSIISKCGFLVCARTHASIAAYSSCVPTLVIGYSVKASGIAEDLDMKKFVLDISGINSSYTIKDSFMKLYQQTDNVKIALSKNQQHYLQLLKQYSYYM